MINLRRHTDSQLIHWKDDPERRVLLLRGARQVGKTYSIQKLGALFENFLEVNFEQEPQIHTFFDSSLNPNPINEKLAAYFGIPIIPGKTLLFFDEIQACPKALQALRFYQEKMPALHVVAAGSLLEFALSEIPSFGVGRISNIFMYPLTFSEFLWAMGDEKLEAFIKKGGFDHPMDPTLHQTLLEKFRIRQVIGGMPAVVRAYLAQRDLNVCQRILDALITTLQDDFAKYKHRAPVIQLQEVFRSIAHQAHSPIGISPQLFYWHRESRSSNAEVDYVIQKESDLIPIEVKAGTKGQMQSLFLFLKERGLPYGVRFSHENFGTYEKIRVMPIYAAQNLFAY